MTHLHIGVHTTNFVSTLRVFHSFKKHSYPAREPWRRDPDLSVFLGAIPDDLGVDCTANTVVKLDIQFGKRVHCRENVK